MANAVQYITNERGERVGVLLDLDAYHQLTGLSVTDPERLPGLSEDELRALAQSALAPADQSRLDDLLERHAEGQLTDVEQAELDRLVADVDHLTLLKTRARYTLAQQSGHLQTS
jgi:hypothetical protein